MPVPVSVTHPRDPAKSLGSRNGENKIMETSGPFARLAQASNSPVQEQAAAPAVVAPVSDTDVPMTSAAPQTLWDLESVVEVNSLDFAYPGLDGRPIPGLPPVVKNMNLKLPPGSCCLLVGPNGAGKTTLLKTLAGKHMVPDHMVRVLGKSAFHDTSLTTSGDLSYVGGNWTRDVAFAGYSIPLAGDFPASKMLDSVRGADPARKEKLIQVLDINPEWRMHMVSDGQRRRVQIAVGLLQPFKVLLLDEITVDLDVLGRSQLMKFLQEECRLRGAVCIYATHIFDGLGFWPSHIAYVAGGELKLFKKAEELPELKEGRLLELVVSWLRVEREERRRLEPALKAAKKAAAEAAGHGYMTNNGWGAGTLNSTVQLANSSNAVMRN
ncbi:uncharacterized protein LOC142357394 [Convolutriloba macropyga]|uniref:uncharacterized protein LOC142357394 n=1 Tax=Convolutriloba macropyga TaxID=536237 RepID=UPI003F52033E